jgi:nucleotide-binding universal stress UspA family protein
MEIRHILAPVDFSDYSKRAVEMARDLAKAFGAKLSLLHVIEPPPYPIEGYAPAGVEAALMDELERQATQELAQLLPAAETAGVEVARHVVIGSPYRKIIETAEAERVDFIVMATAGRTGVSRLVMGSVAERVVRTAPCPVLTIRPQGESAQ